jgi:undecaprenyl pyrophosphate phosphatase UppP
MDRKFIMAALGYAVIGMVLGIYMAASKNHGQFVTHAHIMLLGFVVSFIYGLCHKLWLNNTTSKLAVVQFYIHQAAALILVGGLFMLYGQFMEELNPKMHDQEKYLKVTASASRNFEKHALITE